MVKRERIGEAVVSEMLKRKVNEDAEEFSQLKRRRFLNSENLNDPCATSCFSIHPCSSSNASTGNSNEKLSTLDLQEVSSDGVEMEMEETTAAFNVEETERKETTPFSKLESTTAPPSAADSFHRSTEAKMPSDAELEHFFSAACKDIQKQFSKKYNFDIAKEEPLEGRYEWVQLKP